MCNIHITYSQGFLCCLHYPVTQLGYIIIISSLVHSCKYRACYFHILYSFICTIHRYITQTIHLSQKYGKAHLNSCNFSYWRKCINYYNLTIAGYMHLRLERPITLLFCPIFFKLSYIIQFYMYYPQIHYSNYPLE